MYNNQRTSFAGWERASLARRAKVALAGAATIALAGCDLGQISTGGTISILATTAVPVSTATPKPTPISLPPVTNTLPPVPVASQAPALATKTNQAIVAEGDELSIYGSSNYTGIFAASHPAMTFNDTALAGGGISGLSARLASDLALKPDLVTVFVGADDLAATSSYPSTQAWLDALFAYTDKLRTSGVKVLVATILPRHIYNQGDDAVFNATMAARRIEANAAIIAAAKAGRIDGVIDFGDNPVMGLESAADDRSLYSDGTMPTAGCGYGCGGQGKLAVIYRDAVEKALAS